MCCVMDISISLVNAPEAMPSKAAGHRVNKQNPSKMFQLLS